MLLSLSKANSSQPLSTLGPEQLVLCALGEWSLIIKTPRVGTINFETEAQRGLVTGLGTNSNRAESELQCLVLCCLSSCVCTHVS